MNEFDIEKKKINKSAWFWGLFIFAFGLFFIYQSGYFSGENEPIPREVAVSYVGEFESYESSKNYCWIDFRDGSSYSVHAHTEPAEFYDVMSALEVGTQLSILVNPNNGYVIEVRTDTQELLNFDKSQAAIRSSEYRYMYFGIFWCLLDLSLVIALLVDLLIKKKGANNINEQRQEQLQADGLDSVPLRRAAENVKCRIFLEKQVQDYHICYRRVKRTNELVINGYVYDEYVALLEFAHALYASLDGHSFEVGFDTENYSYIKYDGRCLVRQIRLI